jgi:hypothetical protein
MALGIIFNKSKAEHFLDCLRNGKPISPPAGQVWTHADTLALAGVCHFAAMSHGPGLYKDTDWSKVPAERQEAIEDTLFSDLAAAVEWHSHQTMLVADGEYDAHWEPEHRAIVSKDADGPQVIVVDGYRG